LGFKKESQGRRLRLPQTLLAGQPPKQGPPTRWLKTLRQYAAGVPPRIVRAARGVGVF